MDLRLSGMAWRRLLLGGALLVSMGCGGRATYPVAGKVLWPDGTPAKELAGGMVQFDLITDDAKEKVSPYGGIEADGSYRLGTFKPGDGAPAGKYRVLLMPLIWTEGMLGDKPAPPPVLDQKYQRFETSGIEVVVEPKSNEVPLKAERVKRRQ